MKPLPVFKRPVAYAMVVALWAAIYLPGLGSVEIKGEEIRRIMPAVAMLQTGNWIVPEFNGVPYLRKPPLVNWAIAGSIKTLGVRSEWTARLPSVLAMLALGLVVLGTCAEWLGTEGALAAALMVLTSAGIVEKGRLAEIEAIYIAFSGMAMACWLGWTMTGRSRWATWVVTGLLLGLGVLAKGPVHLAYFYVIAVPVGWMSWRKRGTEAEVKTGLLSWAHLAGIGVMLGVFALWCVPYLHATAQLGAAGVWARQMQQRMGGGDTSTVWKNFFHSLINFLPWALGLPWLWSKAMLGRLTEREALLVRAARVPVVVCAFALMLIPGMLPRYTLPLVIPYAILLALLMKGRWGREALRWPLVAACATGVGMMGYGVIGAPRVGAHGPSRDFAAEINARKPAGDAIYIFDPGIQPEIFYIRGPLRYTDTVKTLPADVPWMLAPDNELKMLRGKFREVDVVAKHEDPGGRGFSLVGLKGYGDGSGQGGAKK